jgi:hypothetical protein
MLPTFITSIDHFSEGIELYFNKEKKMKTFYGGVISLLMYLACLAFTISIGIHLVFRLNPTTITSTQSQPISPIIDIYKEDMIFAFTIIDNDFNLINDPSIVTYSVKQQIINRTESSYNEIPIKLVNCSEYKDFYTQRGFEKEYLNNYLDNAYCLSREKEALIGGTYTDSYYSAIQINLSKCTNGTGVVCKSDKEINERLKLSFFEFYYLDWNVDPNNYEKPFSRYFSNYFILLDPTASKISNIYFKPALISSNLGLIFDSFENKTEFVYDYFREQITTQSDGSFFFNGFLNISQNISIYTRVYMKFQDFFANLGGLFQVCLFIGTVLTQQMTRYQMNEHMMNSLFTFKKENDNLQNSIGQISQISKSFNDNQNLFKNYFNVKVNRQSDNIIGRDKQIEFKIKEFTQTTRHNFRLSFGNKIVKVFSDVFCCKCFKNKAVLYYNAAYRKLNSYIDYIKVTKLLREFKQFKKIMLNQDQVKLFKYHKKRVITLDNIENENQDKQKEINYLELYNVFQKCQEEAKKDEICKRLVEKFDQNLAFLFGTVGQNDQSFLNIQGKRDVELDILKIK